MSLDADRESRLLATFVHLLDDHEQAFDGFFRDITAVRFCAAPIDAQQLGRLEYALQNMEIRLLTIQNCIQAGGLEAAQRDKLIAIKNSWLAKKARVDDFLRSIQHIVDSSSEALRPLRSSMGAA